MTATETAIDRCRELKAQHPDFILFVSVDDRYLAFGADAELVSRVTGLAVVDDAGAKSVAVDENIIERPLRKLFAAGHRVALVPHAKGQSC